MLTASPSTGSTPEGQGLGAAVSPAPAVPGPRGLRQPGPQGLRETGHGRGGPATHREPQGRPSVSQAGCCGLSRHGQRWRGGALQRARAEIKVQQSRRDLGVDDTGRDPSCVAVGSPSEDGCVKAPSTSACCKVRRSECRVGLGDAFWQTEGGEREPGEQVRGCWDAGRQDLGHPGLTQASSGPICPLTLLQTLEVLPL